LCVCDICSTTNESQPKIPHHIALLRESGLVISRREGKSFVPQHACVVDRSYRKQLELTQEHFNDDQLIDYVLQYPILINRQIVVTPPGTRLCRPSEVMHPGKKSRTVIP